MKERTDVSAGTIFHPTFNVNRFEKGSPPTAAAYDSDRSFMPVEITEDAMHFRVISRAPEIGSGTYGV